MSRAMVRARRTHMYRISLNRVLTVVIVTLYPLILLWGLREVIAPTWSYMGFNFAPPANSLILGLTLIMAIMPGWIMPVSGARPSSVIVWILYLLAYVPSQIVPIFASGRQDEGYILFQFSLMVGFLIILVFGAFRPPAFPSVRLDASVFWFAIFAFTALVYVSAIRSYGLPTRFPGLGDVYDVREDFGQAAAGSGPFLSYGLGWQYKVINPFLTSFGLLRKSYGLAILGFVGQLIIYSLNGHKTILFSTLLIAGLIVVLRNNGRSLGPLFSLGATAMVLGSVIFDLLLRTNWGTSLFLRRLVLVPGLLTGYYHEFFASNPLTYEIGPFFRYLVDYPYEARVPRIIAALYFDDTSSSANANLWADGYSSFGYFGVILFSVITGVILLLFNSLGRRSDPVLVSLVAGVAAFSWVNSALMTSILTHGIGLSLLLLLVMPSSVSRVRNFPPATNLLKRPKSNFYPRTK